MNTTPTTELGKIEDALTALKEYVRVQRLIWEGRTIEGGSGSALLDDLEALARGYVGDNYGRIRKALIEYERFRDGNWTVGEDDLIIEGTHD